MNNIYKHHRTAFKNISAYVIVKDNERIGTVTIKHGNSRLTAYVHEYGNEMVRGTASGYGYDKASAAIASATRHLPDSPMQRALALDDGRYWYQNLERAGFNVWQVI